MNVQTASSERVVARVVEQGARLRRGEHGRRAGHEHDEQDRLRAGRDVLGIVLAQRVEDRTRAQQHGRDAQPPGALGREPVLVPCRVEEHTPRVDVDRTRVPA